MEINEVFMRMHVLIFSVDFVELLLVVFQYLTIADLDLFAFPLPRKKTHHSYHHISFLKISPFICFYACVTHFIKDEGKLT